MHISIKLTIEKYSITSEARTLIITAVSNSFLSPQEKNPITADIIVFGVIFLFIRIMVVCVYSLESPQ